MKAWGVAVAVAAVLTAGTAGAAEEKARPRAGSGSGSSSVGARHHSGSGGSSRSSGSGETSSRSDADDAGDSQSRSTPTAAQLRHPRAGTGTGWRHRDFRGRSYWYDPYYYSWRGAGWYGWSGWYGRPYGWYSPYAYGGYYGYAPYQHRYGYSRTGSVRVLVKPNDAAVYVDGYYAGIADDFDGLLQRLHLTPGRHEIALKLAGYRTHKLKLYVPYDHTIKLHHKMVRGSGEDVAEQAIGRPEDVARFERAEDEDDGYEPRRERDYEPRREREGSGFGDRGLVELEVSPADASVYVDGVFRGTARDVRRLRLTGGRHRIEVVRPGYRTVEREVEVADGETVEVAIDLVRG